MFSLRGLARDRLTPRVSQGSSESKHAGIGPVPPPLPRRATAGGPSWKHAGVYIPSGWHHKNTCAAFQPERQFGRSPVVRLDKQMFQPLRFMAVTGECSDNLEVGGYLQFSYPFISHPCVWWFISTDYQVSMNFRGNAAGRWDEWLAVEATEPIFHT